MFSEAPRPNVILITLDCVRREALSCYRESFPRMKTLGACAHTPNIDRIAAHGVLFEQAICQAPHTPGSHASILSGLNPYRHGVRGMFDFRLSQAVQPLAARLKRQGYRTAAFIGSHALGSHYGLARGFDVYDEQFDQVDGRSWVLGYRRPGWETTDRTLAWLKRGGAKPFFVFVHYFDAHGGDHTSQSSAGGGRMLERLRRALVPGDGRSAALLRLLRGLRVGPHVRSSRRIRHQLAKVREIDGQIGRILDFLDRQHTYENTFLVVVSDHGEAFGEHGEMGHRAYLYDTTIRIPLILKTLPGLAGRRAPFLTRSIDICPSLLAALGTPPEQLDGVDLHPLLKSGRGDGLKAYCETRFEMDPDDYGNLRTHFVSLRSARWKLILDRLKDSTQLFRLDSDPGENDDVSLECAETLQEMEAELSEMTAEMGPEERVEMPPEQRSEIRRRLHALGYL